MPETLCIAELEDGRRALCYINPDAQTAELVLILRPEDINPRQQFPSYSRFIPPDVKLCVDKTEVTDARPMRIPPRPQPPRITTDDLLRMAKGHAEDAPRTAEEQILKDLEDLQGGGDAPV